MKEYASASEQFTKALDVDSSYGVAYMNRGTSKEMLRDFDGACLDWQKALELGMEQAKKFMIYCVN